MNFSILLVSIVLGLSLAIPVGPITIEMMRRHLHYGVWQGLLVVAGASSADLLYLILVLFGMLPLIAHSPLLLDTIAVFGAALLLWFAYRTMRASSTIKTRSDRDSRLWHCFVSGFLIAFLSPFNILFWLSIAAGFTSTFAQIGTHYVLACAGVLIGIALWFVGLACVIQVTRHYLSAKTIKTLNILGGICLVAFAGYALYRVF